MSDQNSQPQRPPRSTSLGEILTDLATLGGVISITFGAWQIYQPAGFIVGGTFLLTGAWFAARRSAG